MKNINTSGTFQVISGLVLLSAIIIAWYALSLSLSMVVTDNELWVDIVAGVMVASIVRYVASMLLADDKRTFTLSGFLAGASGALVVVMFVAVNAYHTSGNDLSKVPELIAWAVPAMLAAPVIIGYCFFTHRALDRYWGENKDPMVSGSTSAFLKVLEKWLDRIGTGAALLASAIGTYALVYGATKDNWIALFYVGTIELAIFWFMQLNERTYDRTVFWSAFGIASIAFLAALLIQLGNASHIVNAGERIQEIGGAIKTYWFIPPALFATLGIVLYIHNQTKVPELFGSNKGRIAPSPSSGFAQPSWQNTRPPQAQGQQAPRQTPNQQSARPTAPGGDGKIPPGLRQHLLNIGYSESDMRDKSLEQLRVMARSPKAGAKKEQAQNDKRATVSEQDFMLLRTAGLSPQDILSLSPAELQLALVKARGTKSEVSQNGKVRAYASQPGIVIQTDDDDGGDDEDDDDENP